MNVFIIKMRLDDTAFRPRETYHIFAKTAGAALGKAYKQFEKDTKFCDQGTMTLLSLERVEATVVR